MAAHPKEVAEDHGFTLGAVRYGDRITLIEPARQKRQVLKLQFRFRETRKVDFENIAESLTELDR